jgi:hypothetical protein
VWNSELARRDLASGEFDGYIIDAASKLFKRLPRGYQDFDDILQVMRGYTLEAIDDFRQDEHPDTKFTTYLFGHLRMRSLQWFNWAWLPMQHPKGAGVFHFSAYEEFSEDGEFNPSLHIEHNERELEISELLTQLSDRSKEILKCLLGVIDENLLEAFYSTNFEREVSRLTGFEAWEVRLFREEMQEDLPKFVSLEFRRQA